MTPTLDETKQKLKEKRDKLNRKLAEISARESKEARKKRTRELIELGGIVRMVFPDTIDKDLVLGALLNAKEILNNPEKAGVVANMRKAGAAEFAKREAEKQAKKKPTGGD